MTTTSTEVSVSHLLIPFVNQHKAFPSIPSTLSCPGIFLLLEEHEQHFVLSSFLGTRCSQRRRNHRGCSVSLAGIPPSAPAWETSALVQQLPVCAALRVYSQGGRILLTFFIAGHKEQFFYQKMNKHSCPTFTGIFKLLAFYLISYP